MSRLEKYTRQLGRDDPTVKELLEVAEHRPDMRGSIADYLLRLLEEKAGNVVDQPPFTIASPARDYNNPFLMGTALRGNGPGYDYMVDMDSFTQSGGIFGIPGSGKSTLAQVIAIGVVKAGGRMIIFDVMHEHHRLIQAFPPGDVCVLELGKTERENPLEPPGNLPPKDWIGIEKNILREQFLRDGSTNLFEDIMNRAYRSYGVSDGGRGYPTLKKILSGSLEKTDFKLGTRSYGFKESLTDRMRPLAAIPSFDVVQGYDLAEILRTTKIIILRLGNYSSDIRLFYVNLKLEKIRQCLAEHPGEFGRIVILLEESYELTSPLLRKRADITEPLIYRCIRQFRRYGASFLLVDHFAAGTPRPIWACFNNIFVMRQSETNSILSIAAARNLDEEQADFLSKVPLQHVVYCPGDDEPRLIRVSDLNLPPVSEEQLDEYMAPILGWLKYVPDDGSPPPVDVSTGKRDKSVTLKKIDRQVLEQVLEHPFRNVSGISRLLGDFSPIIAKNSLKKLEDQGYIESLTANLGMGRPKKLYLVAEKGAELLGEDYQKTKPKGKGSLLHKAAQYLICETLGGSTKGVLVEYGSADVAEVLGGGRIRAYELELHPDSGDIVNQIITDFKAGFAEVVVLAINKEELERVKKRVYRELKGESGQGEFAKADQLNNVRFELLKKYVNV